MDEEDGCAGVLADKFTGQHIKRWRWILSEISAGDGAQGRRRTPMAAEPTDYCWRWYRRGGVARVEGILFPVDVSLGGEKGSNGSMNPDDGFHQHKL